MKEEKDISFYRKVITSIKYFEEYPKLASRSWGVVLAYMLKLLAIFTIIVTIAFTFSLISGKNLKSIGVDGEQQEVLIDKLIENNVLNINKNSTEGFDSMVPLISIFIITYVFAFLSCILSVTLDVVLLGAFGYFTAIILRLRLKYTAMCKIAVHSLTLPIILNAIYILIQTFTTFEIKYFQAMYVGIAYIYIITAILMIKSDIIKNQQELTKILQEQERVRQELERQKQEEEAKKEEERQEEEKQRQREKEKENDDEQNEENGKEPQGENA